MTHARPEVSDADVRLSGPTQVGLGDEHVAHRQHSQPPQLLRGVEHHGREATRHLRVESDLDPSLDLVLTLDEQVEQLLGVHHRLAEIRHQADQSRVPLVHDLVHRVKPISPTHICSSLQIYNIILTM